MLRLVTYYTPSHEAMCRRFVLARAWGFDEVRSTACEQTCATGEFKASGWNDCMLDKLATLLALPVDDAPTLYVDSDVCLFPGLADWCRGCSAEIGDNEIAFSDDVIQLCAGVMLFRCTSRVRAFWQTLADMSVVWDLPDQEALYLLQVHARERNGRLPIRPRLLPRDMFCNWATVQSDVAALSPWNGEAFAVPPKCLAWHANWTIGLDNKQRMLERVVMRETSAA